MAEPLVYVIVVNWNGRAHLEVCFDSLLRTTYPHVRFLLVDNASSDDSVEFVRTRYGDDSRVEIRVCSRNLNWSGGNNAGLELARTAGAAYALLLNNDTAVEPDAIARLAAHAEAAPEVGALAPKLLLYDSPGIVNSVGLELSAIGAAWDRGLGRLDAPRWNESVPVAGVCGAGMFLRMSVLDATGLFPESFEIYLDDLDLCLRIWDAGSEVRTCPDAVIRHKFSSTMGRGALARRKYYLNTRNRARIVLLNFPAARLPGAAFATFLGECRAVGRALLDGASDRAWAHVRAWFAMLGYLPAAFRERVRRRGAGMRPGRFWSLVRRRPVFFGGVELPEDGWYRVRRVGGVEVRPMSARANFAHPGGRLRVVQTNCYPRLGAPEVRVYQNGREVGRLNAADGAAQEYDLPAGEIEFVAARIFAADDTGEAFDIGGWIGVEAVES